MTEIKVLSEIMIKLLGPLMLAFLAIMYFQVYFSTGQRPQLRGVIMAYARLNLQKRRHVGLMTYAFVVSAILFMFSIIGVLLSRFLPAS